MSLPRGHMPAQARRFLHLFEMAKGTCPGSVRILVSEGAGRSATSGTSWGLEVPFRRVL